MKYLIKILSADEVDFILAAKSSRAYRLRCNKLSGINNNSKNSLMKYIDDNFPENSEPRCNFCNSIKKIKSFDYILEDNILYIDNIEYIDSLNICRISKKLAYIECSRFNFNPNSREFISILYNISDTEALDIIHKRNSSPFYRENHDSEEEYSNYQRRDVHFYGEDKFKKVISKIKYKNSIERYIKDYGSEGIKKYKDIQKSKDSSSLKHFMNLYSEDEAKIRYEEKKKKCLVDKQSYIKRYGEIQGLEKFMSAQKSRIEKLNKRLEDMSEEDRRKLWDKSSLDYFISTYGVVEGEKKFKEHCIKTSPGKTSKESLLFLKQFVDKCKEYNLKYYIGDGDKKEYFIYDETERKISFYDFCIPELKIIIEYHGSMFHFNPKYNYKNNFIKLTGKSLNEMREKDTYKRRLAKDNGFSIFEIFDTDVNNLDKIKEIYNIINERKDKLDESRII